ncbi:hypothetical protein F5B22DRAFT_650183 [Xylaria bambusicola]|uniref:uncharacterized protein n=1 Tax=Xylaria bambusicola TaxID=326684 RepID=UPI0020089863|nr:uncharacterized protein F5B22DRAFT_650183 [Xylaria bambusicola]KAI0508328.1 hypothetical protein F5B22DRAFT_650183 [Xylaria bambusicola]
MAELPVLPVLRFPVSGQENGSFLVEVASNGSRPLDLKLIGSESTVVFVVKLRHKKIIEYKADPGHCTDEEWEQILTSTFVDQKPVPDVEIRADVQPDENSVTLSFRKNIQGITQRLGSINLVENDRTEISPFDWCVSAIESRVKVTEELAAATTKIESLQQSIDELKAQLEDFITTKEEDEKEMLEKFQDLLNAKKLKIRQQLRLLAAAKVDPEKLGNIGGDEGQDVHRNAGPSRSGKRKATVKEEEGESDDGFEKMDVDNGATGDRTDSESEASTDQDQQLNTDNDATESDPGTDDEPPTAAEVKRKGAVAGRITKPKAQGKKPATRSSETTRVSRAKQAADMDESEDNDEMPPPRVLPFMAAKKAAAPPPKPVDDDETPSDDDSEL